MSSTSIIMPTASIVSHTTIEPSNLKSQASKPRLQRKRAFSNLRALKNEHTIPPPPPHTPMVDHENDESPRSGIICGLGPSASRNLAVMLTHDKRQARCVQLRISPNPTTFADILAYGQSTTPPGSPNSANAGITFVRSEASTMELHRLLRAKPSSSASPSTKRASCSVSFSQISPTKCTNGFDSKPLPALPKASKTPSEAAYSSTKHQQIIATHLKRIGFTTLGSTIAYEARRTPNQPLHLAPSLASTTAREAHRIPHTIYPFNADRLLAVRQPVQVC